MLETLFILGREPELSVAELEAVVPRWPAEVLDVRPEGVLLCHAQPLPPKIIDRLGGSLKQVDVLECFDANRTLEDIVRQHCTADWLTKQFAGRADSRIEFGVSVYGWPSRQKSGVLRHFLNLKKAVHRQGRVVRFVTSREPHLSTVTVRRNGLDDRGKEFVFFRTSRAAILGTTRAVQDYQAYARRDRGRPAADPKSGMLPPKLAQMMLNIAGIAPDDVLLDPFCGSGTILQEAALLGIRRIYGSDRESRAIKAGQENIRWLLKEFPQLKVDIEVNQRDARETRVRPTVIVTEPYLGPPLRGREPLAQLKKQQAMLEQLYLQTFQHWKRIMPKGGRIVMIWPEILSAGKNLDLRLDQAVSDLGFELQPLLSRPSADVLNITHPLVLSYGRDEARVRRQIRLWQYS